MIKKMNQQEIRLALFTGILLLGWGCVSVVFSPLIEKNEQLATQIQANVLKLRKNRQTIKQTRKLEKLILSLDQKGVLTPSEAEDNTSLLALIEKIQKNIKIQPINYTPLATEALGDGYQQFKVKVKMNDSLANITRFLFELNLVPEKLNITHFRLSGEKTKKQGLRASFVLNQLGSI